MVVKKPMAVILDTDVVGPAPFPWTLFRLRLSRLIDFFSSLLLDLATQGSLTAQPSEAPVS